MKKFIQVKNNGLIHEGDLMLIGSSTKRNQKDKIGMFGSGWKYTLAYLLRNKLDVKIFSGKDEVVVSTTMVMHRDNLVEVITINGKETSMTTDMGPLWTGWMAVREIISNAIDEGGFEMNTVLNPQSFGSEENITTIFIEANDEINNCFRDFESYFAFERTPDAENSVGKIYLHSNNEDYHGVLYRKGIRAYHKFRETKFDFDFNDITINESRLINGEGDIDSSLSKFMKEGNYSLEVFKALITSKYHDFLPYSLNQTMIGFCKELIDDGYALITPQMDGIRPYLNIQGEVIIISNKWYETLVFEGHIKSAFDDMNGNAFVETNDHSINVHAIKGYLEKFNLDINMKVGIWKSHFDNVMYVQDNDVLIIHQDRCEGLPIKEVTAQILTKIPARIFHQAL